MTTMKELTSSRARPIRPIRPIRRQRLGSRQLFHGENFKANPLRLGTSLRRLAASSTTPASSFATPLGVDEDGSHFHARYLDQTKIGTQSIQQHIMKEGPEPNIEHLRLASVLPRVQNAALADFGACQWPSTEKPENEKLTRKEAHAFGKRAALSRRTLTQVLAVACSAMLEPVLSAVDNYYCSLLGTQALAALGPSNAVFSSALAVIAAHAFGAASTRVASVALARDSSINEHSERDKATTAAHIVSSVFAVCAVVAAVAMVGFVLFPGAVAHATGAHASVHAAASSYLRVRAFGLPATFVLAGLGGCYHAARDGRTPLIALSIAAVANIVLDPLLMFKFNMGLEGAALATVLSQSIAALLLLRHTFFGRSARRKFFQATGLVAPWPSKPACVTYLRGIYSLIGRALNILVVWTMAGVSASRLGVVHAASHQVLFGLVTLANVATGSLCVVSNATVARVRELAGNDAAMAAGYHLARVGALYCMLSAVTLFVARSEILNLLSADSEVAAHAKNFVPILAMAASLGFYKALEGGMIGFGASSALSTTFTAAASTCVVMLLLGGASSLGGIWYALLGYYVVLTLGTSMWFWRSMTSSTASRH